MPASKNILNYKWLVYRPIKILLSTFIKATINLSQQKIYLIILTLFRRKWFLLIDKIENQINFKINLIIFFSLSRFPKYNFIIEFYILFIYFIVDFSSLFGFQNSLSLKNGKITTEIAYHCIVLKSNYWICYWKLVFLCYLNWWRFCFLEYYLRARFDFLIMLFGYFLYWIFFYFIFYLSE